LNETFASLFNITEEGIIVFDFIDANRFIPYINKKSYTKQRHEEINYIREATGNDYLDNFMVEWTAKYYTFINGRKDRSNDFSTVRYLR
jgi:hypothetical protein